jgi:hypothetical protein
LKKIMIKTSPIWLSLILFTAVLAQVLAPNAAATAAPGAPATPAPTSKAADDHEVLRPALLTPRDAGNTFVYLQAYHSKSEKFNSCLMAVREMPEIEALRQNGITLREMSYKHYINPKLVRKEVNDSCHHFDQIITACARLGVWVPDASGFMEGHLCQNYRELKYDKLRKGKDDVVSKKHKRKSKKKKVDLKPDVATPEATTTPPAPEATPTTPPPTTTPDAAAGATQTSTTPPTTPDAATATAPSTAPTATPAPTPTAGLTPPAAPVSTPQVPATPAAGTPAPAEAVPTPTIPEAVTASAAIPVPAPTTPAPPVVPTPAQPTTQQSTSVTG